MRKITVLLLLMAAALCGMQVSAQPAKSPSRSNIYNYLPTGYQRLGNTSIYYNVSSHNSAGMGYRTGYSLVGKIGNYYYSSTYEPGNEYEGIIFSEYHPGAGFIGAFQVNNGTATYFDAANGTTLDGVRMTSRIEAQGDVAALITYTLTNNNDEAVSVNVGVYGDIMIGDNDDAPLEMLTTSSGKTYGIKMKYENSANSPLLCALFGEYVTGVTAADDYWFGFFSSNWHPGEICGDYSSTIYPTNTDWPASNSQYYMKENGNYDSGLGFCWKDRTIEAHESIELSYLISVGEIEFEEPVIPDDPEPGEDIFTYNVEVFDGVADGYDWNALDETHKGRISGTYEHPYGQTGYIEYQVDDENTWHRMDGELISGAEDGYELFFDVNFNENRDTDHVLRLRFTDGLDNYTELEGLSWIDVRSFNVNGIENRVYNGEPQVFEVSITREVVTYVGETNPGTYSFTIEGVYADNTIGVKEVPYTIDKAQSVIDVIIPESVEYDGNPHGATVTLTVGDGDVTVTYIDPVTGEPIDGEPTEIGTYDVYIEVSTTEFYYGIPSEYYGTIVITSTGTSVKELTVGTKDDNAWYTIDGRRVVAPTAPGIYIHNGNKYIVK